MNKELKIKIGHQLLKDAGNGQAFIGMRDVIFMIQILMH